MMLPLLLVLILSEAPAPRPLARLPLDELLSCAGDATRCDAGHWDLARELSRRHGAKDLLARLEGAAGAQRRVLAFALYLKPASPEVAGLMRALSGDPDEELAYYALNYRLKACEPEALAQLVAPPYRVLAACEQWASTVALVGQCRYTPGEAFLRDSLGHGCLNVVQAARRGLKALQSGKPRPPRR